MSAFVDTSALYALLVRTEERHAATLRAFRRLLRAGRPLWTTSYVLLETVALLQHRIGLAPVLDLDDKLLPLLAVGWVDQTLYRRAMDRLRREGRRQMSLTDCVSFEFMLASGLGEALALDRHFADAGFSVLPPSRG